MLTPAIKEGLSEYKTEILAILEPGESQSDDVGDAEGDDLPDGEYGLVTEWVLNDGHRTRRQRPADEADQAHAEYLAETAGLSWEEYQERATPQLKRPLSDGNGDTPAGWTRARWVERLRELAGGCELLCPERAKELREMAVVAEKPAGIAR